MIREILEKNGYDIDYYGTSYTLISEVFIRGLVPSYGWGTDVISYGDVDDETIEQACRQYVKENGFKLEWLPNIVDTYALKHNDFAREHMTPYADENINKLIAWLYANDIEIKEDNNEM